MKRSRLPFLALVLLWTGCSLVDSDPNRTRLVEVIEPRVAPDQADTLSGTVRIRAKAVDDGRGVSQIRIRLTEVEARDNSQSVTLVELMFDVTPRREVVEIDTVLVLPPDLVLVGAPGAIASDVFYLLLVTTSDGTHSSTTGLHYRRFDESGT